MNPSADQMPLDDLREAVAALLASPTPSANSLSLAGLIGYQACITKQKLGPPAIRRLVMQAHKQIAGTYALPDPTRPALIAELREIVAPQVKQANSEPTEAGLMLAAAALSFAQDKASAAEVESAFARFAVEVGPLIGARQVKRSMSSNGGRKSTKFARESGERWLKNALLRLCQKGPPRSYANVTALVAALYARRGRAQTSKATIRRWLMVQPDLQKLVQRVPKSRRA